MLRIEIDKLLSDAEEYGTTPTDQMALSKGKYKWKKVGKDIVLEELPTDTKVDDRPDIIKQLEKEAVRERGVVIPYRNHMRNDWFVYMYEILAGEEDRIRTPDDAKQLKFE